MRPYCPKYRIPSRPIELVLVCLSETHHPLCRALPCFSLCSLQGSNYSGHYTGSGDDPRRNVLSLGCRVVCPQARSELLSVQGVACAFPNTTNNIIRSPPWEILLSRIGDDLMSALLRQHALLLRLPNRCYMQARCFGVNSVNMWRATVVQHMRIFAEYPAYMMPDTLMSCGRVNRKASSKVEPT